jgi:hypothetical protein
MTMKKIFATIPAVFLVLGLVAVSTRPANAEPMVGSCTVSSVAVFENRIHVRCATPVRGITFFAVSTSDAQNAARFLTIFNSARVNGRPVNIQFDPFDRSGVAFGCLKEDCRVARGAEMF